MRHHWNPLCLLALLPVAIAAAVPPWAGAAELDQQTFQQLHSELQPGDEPWRTIPWQIALLGARETAANQGKPIFIWAMDGHPLGCT